LTNQLGQYRLASADRKKDGKYDYLSWNGCDGHDGGHDVPRLDMGNRCSGKETIVSERKLS